MGDWFTAVTVTVTGQPGTRPLTDLEPFFQARAPARRPGGY